MSQAQQNNQIAPYIEEMKQQMKPFFKQASMREKLRKIALEFPNHAQMHSQFITGRGKCKNDQEREEYDRGCDWIKDWIEKKCRIQSPDFTEQAADQQSAQSSAKPAQSGAKPAKKENVKTKQQRLRLEALQRCESQADSEKSSPKYTPTQFRTMSEPPIKFNRRGERIQDGQDSQGDGDHQTDQQFFKLDESRQLDEVVRKLVYNCLIYGGDLQSMMTQDYFVDENQRDKYHYCASVKVPFYMVYHCSPWIQEELASKYLENPLNAVMFMQYDQQHVGFENLEEPVPEIERQFNISHLYNKLKSEEAPNNLLCIGSPLGGKSSQLNNMFAVNFEKHDSRACGLWHDSVDVIFSSDALPLGFNVFDFHGKMANHDFQMIQDLFERLPNTYLLVQVTDADYLNKLKESVSQETFKQMKDRMIIVSNARNEDKKQSIVQTSQEVYEIDPAENSDEGQRFYEFGDLGKDQQAMAQCAKILTKLKQNFKALRNEFSVELSERKIQLTKDMATDENEYEFIHGHYWYVEDFLFFLQKPETNNLKYRVRRKDDHFRQKHREIKKYLMELPVDQQLNRSNVFQFYMNTHRQASITQSLKRDYKLGKEKIKKLKEEKSELAKASKTLEPHELFIKYFNLLMNLAEEDSKGQEDQEESKGQEGQEVSKQEYSASFKSHQVYDMLNLVEAYYKPFVNEQEDDKKKDFVLDAELFAREARYYTRTESGKPYRERYAQAMASMIEEGKAIEIIDGDIDKLEKDSLVDVMNFIQKRRSENQRLVVITILGPQSTGKSTLLNFLTGAKFHVSAGRCTKGLNAMLLKTEFPGAQDIMILDSEGLFSVERQDAKYDRRLAIFCFSVSNFLLINIKGELNDTVKEVLQVSVYAMKRMKEITNVKSTARPHFILRDINQEGSGQEFQQQLEKIKEGLEEAAKANKTDLNEHLDMQRPQDMMSTFHSAIEKKHVYTKDLLTQTISNCSFHDECVKLRDQLIKFSQKPDHKKAKQSLQAFVEHMADVWTAVTQNDDMVLIKNLTQINDHRDLCEAMTKFRKIMGKTDGGDKKDADENPLLRTKNYIPQNLVNYKKIAPCERLYAKLDSNIQKAVREQDKQETKDDLEGLQKRTLDQLKKEVEVWWKPNGEGGLAYEMVSVFTDDMSKDLQQIGKFFAFNEIEGIHKKATRNFEKQFTEKKVQQKIQFVINALKERPRDEPLEENGIDINVYVQADKENEKDLYDHLPSDEAIREESDNKLKSYCFYVFAEDSEFRSVSQDPAPIRPDFGHDRDKLGSLPYIKMIFEACELPEEELWRIELPEEELWKIIKADEEPLNVCIEDWIKTTDLSTQQKEDLMSSERKKMHQSIKERFVRLLSQVRAQIKKDEQENDEQSKAEIRFNKQKLNSYHQIFSNLLRMQKENRTKRANDAEIISGLDYDKCWKEKDQLGYDFHRKCFQLNTEQGGFFEMCEALILHRLDQQATRNREIKKNKFDDTLRKEIEKLQEFQRVQKQQIRGEESSKFLVQLLVNRAMSELNSCTREKWRQRVINLDTEFSKNGDEGNMEMTMRRFINAGEEDKDFIKKHMTKPVEAEKEVFKIEFKKKLQQIVEEQEEYFASQLDLVIEHLQKVFNTMRDTFKENERHKEELGEDPYRNLVYYLYYLLFFNQWKSYSQETELQQLSECRAHLVKEGVFFNGRAVIMPALPNASNPDQKVFKDGSNSSFMFKKEDWNEDKGQLDKIAKVLAEENYQLSEFFKNLTDIRSMAEEEIEKKKFEMQKELGGLKAEVDSYNDIEKRVLGCLGECPFCGARCEEDVKCGEGNNSKHATRFHRPMAWKGTHEYEVVEEDKKYENGDVVIEKNKPVKEKKKIKMLLDDHCLSKNNLEDSRWPVKSEINQKNFDMLEKLNKSVETNGINMTLEWRTGDDLDICAKCACDEWRDASYQCKECGMHRDIDITTGKERRVAIEHIIFPNPDQLIKKEQPQELGVYVKNYCASGKRKGVDFVKFQITVQNKYGMNIWPEEPQQEWMQVEKRSGEESERKTFLYTKEMHIAGTVNFEQNLKNMTTEYHEQVEWDITKHRQEDAGNSELATAYRNSWNQKWQIVRDDISKHYGCGRVLEVLKDSLKPSEQAQ